MAPDKPLEKLAEGVRGRTLKTIKLAARASFTMARRSFGAKKERSTTERAGAVETAEILLQELDGMKGLIMKFGQMASYLDHALPPEAQNVLARLQSQSQPMASAIVAEVIREELGAPPEVLFDSFEPTPIAAASIGQVHRAQLDGRAVAVKVQYPGITRALDSDLKIVGRFASLGFMFLPLDGSGLTAELRARVIEECDYAREASNQTLFRRLLSDRPDRSVPEVLTSHSTKRVITSVLCSGKRFQEFVAAAPQAARDRAGETIFETCFHSIFSHCVFNADPHPGNYLFGDDGHVTFLDFGCMKWFPVAMIDSWKGLARCLVDGDRAAFPDRWAATGMLGKQRKFDWDAQWAAMRHLYAPFCSKEPTIYDGDFLAKAHDLILFSNPNKMKLQLPPDWLFVNRLQFGLLSVLAHLRARGDWGRLFRAAIETKTSPIQSS